MTEASLSDIRTRVADRLLATVGERKYNRWFADACIDCDEDRVAVAVPNRFAADWIAAHFKPEIRTAAENVFGRPIELNIEVRPTAAAATETRRGGDSPDHQADPAPTVGPVPASKPGPARRSGQGVAATAVSALRYRLDDYLVGATNRLAYSAVQRLVDGEGDELNPLFVHGGCGVGKTHLLQGLCRRFAETHPGRRWRYTTAEQFTNQYIQAVKSNGLPALRNKLRGLDLLVVDDVHFLSNKTATQAEFLHTFDAIDLNGAKVVMASDCHPKQIQQFSEALVSRFVSGMVVGIDLPDPPLRERLVKAMAGRRGLRLVDAVVPVLADHCRSSVREIEGTLNTLAALTKMEYGGVGSEPVGQALVSRLLGLAAPSRPTRPVRFQTILQTVCEALGVEPADVRGKSRHRRIVLARSLAAYLARQLTTMSFPELARALGKGNHSTIITASRRIENQIAARQALNLSGDLRCTTADQLAEELRRRVVSAA